MKRQAPDWRKFSKVHLKNGHYLEYIKNSQNISSNEQKSIGKWAEDESMNRLDGYLRKKDMQVAGKHMKRYSVISHLRNARYNHSEIVAYLSRMAKEKQWR